MFLNLRREYLTADVSVVRTIKRGLWPLGLVAALSVPISQVQADHLQPLSQALAEGLTQVNSAQLSTRFKDIRHWRALYGEGLEFDITRNGDPVGRYQLSFEGEPERWRVRADMQMEFSLLLLFSYQFSYQATEHWHYNWLTGFESRTNRNGDNERNQMVLSAVSSAPSESSEAPTADTGLTRPDSGMAESDTRTAVSGRQILYRVDGVSGQYALQGPVALSNHYNIGIIRETRLFNSLSGRENQVLLKPVGREEVSDGFQPVDTTQYEYTGELEKTWVWYADDGRWLRLRFIADDGSQIQFNCHRCYPDQSQGLRMAGPEEPKESTG